MKNIELLSRFQKLSDFLHTTNETIVIHVFLKNDLSNYMNSLS